jgi:hypothetical protein
MAIHPLDAKRQHRKPDSFSPSDSNSVCDVLFDLLVRLFEERGLSWQVPSILLRLASRAKISLLQHYLHHETSSVLNCSYLFEKRTSASDLDFIVDASRPGCVHFARQTI